MIPVRTPRRNLGFLQASWGGAGEPAGTRAGGGGEKGVPATASCLAAGAAGWLIRPERDDEDFGIEIWYLRERSSQYCKKPPAVYSPMQAGADGSVDDGDKGKISAAGGRGGGGCVGRESLSHLLRRASLDCCVCLELAGWLDGWLNG